MKHFPDLYPKLKEEKEKQAESKETEGTEGAEKSEKKGELRKQKLERQESLPYIFALQL